MSGSSTPLRLEFAALLAGMTVAAAVGSLDAQGPVCPPGFEFQRMSGVGCVQTDCASAGNSRYSYTGQCICNEGYKPCYAPVDYGGFDRGACGPHCPNARLVACVAPDAACPGDQPPARTSPPGGARAPAGGSPASGEARESAADLLDALLDVLAGRGDPDSLAALTRMLMGEDGPAPPLDSLAIGGVVVSGGLTAWLLAEMLLNLLQTPRQAPATGAPQAARPGSAIPAGTTPATASGPMVQRIYDGTNARRILDDLNILQDLRTLERDDPTYWEKVDKTLERAKTDQRVKAIGYDQFRPQGIDEDNIVIVVEEPEQVAPTPPPSVAPTPPPQTQAVPPVVLPPPVDVPPAPQPPPKPPVAPPPSEPPPLDIVSLREKRLRELQETEQRVRQLEEAMRKVAEEHARRALAWQRERYRGFLHGLVEVADLVQEGLKLDPLKSPPNEKPDLREGVGTAYLKDLIKATLKALADRAVDWRLGVPGRDAGRQVQHVLYEPLGLRPRPGGALKQFLINALVRLRGGGGGFGHALDVSETFGSAKREMAAFQKQLQDLRRQMGNFQERFHALNRDYEQAVDDLDTARKGVQDVDRAIGQLKRESKRFGGL